MPKKKYYGSKMKPAQESGMTAGAVGASLLPQAFILKYYPKDGGYLPENLNDGLGGIDKQVNKDVRDTKKELSPDKY